MGSPTARALNDLRREISENVAETVGVFGKDLSSKFDTFSGDMNEIKLMIQSMISDRAPTGKEEEKIDNMALEDAAKKDQEDHGEYDLSRVFETLRDPYPRTARELGKFLSEAVDSYEDHEEYDVVKEYKQHFKYWTEDHFKSVPRRRLKSLRDLIFEKGAKVRKETRYPIAKALYEYLQDDPPPVEETPPRTVVVQSDPEAKALSL